jgi:LDH2 family malate/lactate/ureidoglycolate dehydrogenase
VRDSFIAIDPAKFGGGFDGRMAEMIGLMHGLPLAEGAKEVMVPGEPEARRTADARAHGACADGRLI